MTAQGTSPLTAGLLSVLAGALACSESDPGTSMSAGSGGGGGAESSGVAGGGAGGASMSAGASGAGAGGASNGGTGAASMTGFMERGVCGQRSDPPEDPTDLENRTVVTLETFEGYDEYYLIDDRGFGMDTCVVRFEVSRIGAGPAGCDDCAWTHLVEYTNPEVLVDVDGVCAESELGLDAERIAEIDGSQVAYGYVYEYSGHVSVFMKYDDASATWIPNGNGTWNEETGAFTYDRRDGVCGY